MAQMEFPVIDLQATGRRIKEVLSLIHISEPTRPY